MGDNVLEDLRTSGCEGVLNRSGLLEEPFRSGTRTVILCTLVECGGANNRVFETCTKTTL